jgi:hypothetical protein
LTQRVNLTGKKFGKLTVIKKVEPHNNNTTWLCECDCGNYAKASTGSLNSGDKKSCGCIQGKKHGFSKHRIYAIWYGMINRCNNPKNHKYSSYGGRGIDVCEQWNEFENFKDWAFSNGYKGHLQIDRIDNDSGYSPSNCRWVTSAENSLNKRNSHFLTIGDKTMTIAEWGRLSGLTRSTISNRIIRGWKIEDILNPSTRPRVSSNN